MTDKPKRIQRKRTKGWRMPDGAVYVGRPTKWCNPFTKESNPIPPGIISNDWREQVVFAHAWGMDYLSPDELAELQRELRGKDLVCWCTLDQPCHADTLLGLANMSEVQP